MTPLEQLKQGNERFVASHSTILDTSAYKREQLGEGQEPIAAVLACSDSRVATEILFDQGLGKLFIVRLAGNVVTPVAIDSLEFAVSQLHVPLIVVLGHTSCGAVTAALNGGDEGELMALLQPAIKATENVPPKDRLQAAIIKNVELMTAKLLQQSKLIKERLADGTLELAKGEFHIVDGHIDWF